MVVEGVINGTTDFIESVSPELGGAISNLITALQIAGIIVLIYVAYLIVKGVLRWKDRKRLKRVEQKLNKIDLKIDAIYEKLGLDKGGREGRAVGKSAKNKKKK
jgi:hypothetical protein